MARLSSFYLAYYAALGAFSPYWSLFLQSRGVDVEKHAALQTMHVVVPLDAAVVPARLIRER